MGEEGNLLALNDIIDKIGGEDAFTKDSLMAKEGDNWWSVPCLSRNIVLGYREDILKASGYSQPPKNWYELYQMSINLTKDNQYGLGMNLSNTELIQEVYFSFVKAAGGSFEDETGRITVGVEKANADALHYLSSIYIDGYIPKEALKWKNGDELKALANGQIAMSIGWGGFGSTIKDKFPDQVKNIKYATLPTGPSEQSGSYMGNAGLFIFKESKQPEAAKNFIEFLMQKEIQKKWMEASGNISPIKSVAGDSDLNKASWYKAMTNQAETSTNYYIGGKYNPALREFAQSKGYVPHIQKALERKDGNIDLYRVQLEIEKNQKNR